MFWLLTQSMSDIFAFILTFLINPFIAALFFFPSIKGMSITFLINFIAVILLWFQFQTADNYLISAGYKSEFISNPFHLLIAFALIPCIPLIAQRPYRFLCLQIYLFCDLLTQAVISVSSTKVIPFHVYAVLVSHIISYFGFFRKNLDTRVKFSFSLLTVTSLTGIMAYFDSKPLLPWSVFTPVALLGYLAVEKFIVDAEKKTETIASEQKPLLLVA
jgi:hypothetical protein